jgi:hypothetical protein
MMHRQKNIKLFLLCLQFSESRLTRVKQGD